MIDAIVTVGIILVNVAAVLNVLLILYMFFGARLNLTNKRLAIVASVYSLINLIFAFIPGSDTYTIPMVFLCMVLFILIFSTEKRLINCFLAVPAALMYVQWATIFSMIERLFGLDQISYNYQDVISVKLSTFLPDYLLVGILLVLFNKVNKAAVEVKLSRAEGIILTVVCMIYPIVVQFFSFLEGSVEHPLYTPFWIVGMLLINFAIVYAVVRGKRSVYYKQVANQYKNQFQSEYDYFKDYKESNEQIIKFCHDWNNHMIVIKDLMNRGEYERANTYFSEMMSEGKLLKQSYVTGNEIVDVILKSKHDLLQEHKISFEINGNLTGIGSMKDVDCCILFSNIIDNAIEANLTCDGAKYISMTVQNAKNTVHISVSNPYGTKEEPIPKTNGEIHGIGLLNVKEIVEKYSGECSICKQDGVFVITCVLPHE